jgi:hypothetical protein
MIDATEWSDERQAALLAIVAAAVFADLDVREGREYAVLPLGLPTTLERALDLLVAARKPVGYVGVALGQTVGIATWALKDGRVRDRILTPPAPAGPRFEPTQPRRTTVGVGRVGAPDTALISLTGHACWYRNYTWLPLGTHQGVPTEAGVERPLSFRLEFRPGREET